MMVPRGILVINSHFFTQQDFFTSVSCLHNWFLFFKSFFSLLFISKTEKNIMYTRAYLKTKRDVYKVTDFTYILLSWLTIFYKRKQCNIMGCFFKEEIQNYLCIDLALTVVLRVIERSLIMTVFLRFTNGLAPSACFQGNLFSLLHFLSIWVQT